MIVDYVIVGAGSAGSILAERLSRNGRYSVDLLEAGGTDRKFWVDVPLGFGRLFYDPKVNWAYDTEPDPRLGGRSDYWPRGKIIGGSSSINALVYIRGDRADYDDWANEGNQGWSWQDVAPYFDEIETRTTVDTNSNERYGLHVHDVSTRYHPLSQHVIKAANALQLPFNPDFNGETQEGVGYYRMTSGPDNRRMSSARAFLRPALKRKNLRVEKHAHVTRIEFDRRHARAVHYRQNGQTHRIEAGKEIILATGTIGSPQLLQHSGFGPASLLKSRGIDVVADNPNVGAHLQDHLGWDAKFRSRVPTVNNQLSTNWARIRQGIRYLLRGTGPLALSINQAGGFFKTDPSQPRPNMQLYFQAMTALDVKHDPGIRPTLTPDSFPAFSLGFA
ncbi:MAG: GMC family oxidoreductase, partial [Hyphomicrobiaceae bacterium]